MKIERQQTFETYNHRILWGAALRNLLLATSSNKDTKFFALASMLLSILAFEGYLNWLGSRIAPEVWENERQLFSAGSSRGTLGKYRFLAKLLRLPTPDPSQGAFQTAKQLLKLRDKIVHPKTEAGERFVKFKEGHFPPRYQSELEKEVSPDAATRAKDHLEKLAEELHREAQLAYSGNVHETHAFRGPLSRETTDT